MHEICGRESGHRKTSSRTRICSKCHGNGIGKIEIAEADQQPDSERKTAQNFIDLLQDNNDPNRDIEREDDKMEC